LNAERRGSGVLDRVFRRSLSWIWIVSVRIEWLARLPDIEALEGPWRALESATVRRTVASSFDYLVPWYRHYSAQQGDVVFGAAWEGRELAGVAPLLLRKERLGRVPMRQVDFAASDYEAGEFLVADDRLDVIGAFLRSLAAHVSFDVLVLKNMAPGSPHTRAVEEAAPGTGFAVEQTGSAYAVVDLEGGYDAYVRATEGRLGKYLKKRAKKFSSLGIPTLDGAHFSPDIDRMVASVERTFDVNDASWKARGRGPLGQDHREFCRELCARFARRGMADVSILTIGGADMAYMIGVAERGVYYDVSVSYSERFQAYRPGFRLMEYLFRALPSLGIRTVVSHGAHAYKRTWATGFTPIATLFLFRPGVRAGLGRFLKFRVKPALGGTEPVFD
jgi:Acetyltransferase (GNAT) domain